MQYLCQRLRGTNDPSVEFPLCQVSEDSEYAMCKPSFGAYPGGVCTRTEFGRQQGLQLGPIQIAVMYDLLYRHDAEILLFSSFLA